MRDIVPLAVIGVGFAVLSPVLGYPLMSITFLGIAAIAFLNHLNSRMRLEVEENGVALQQQPPWRNPVVLLAVIFAVMACATLAQVFVGANSVDVRLLIIAIALCGIAALLGVITVRTSGPVHITGTEVTFWNTRKFRIEDDDFSVEPKPRGPPVVTFSGSKSGAVSLTHGQFGTDAETVAATLEQLRIWNKDGRRGTAGEIAAMLAVAPPTGLSVGESVVLEVRVPLRGGNREPG